MNRKAKAILMEKFAGKVVGIDNKAFVNGDSVNEYLHPSKFIGPDIRKAKLTAASELDNLLDAGQALPNEPDGRDGHIHPDAMDFSYFRTTFKIGQEYFEGIVNIKNIKRGKLLKDITKIRNITKDIVSSYGKNPKSNFLRNASMDSIFSSPQNVKEKFSLRDSDGNKLSEQQQEYFKDSKVRDADGNLLVMYHGTPNGGFTKFRSGTYFTQNKAYADVYQGQGASSLSYKKTADNPYTYQAYLNITKPFDTRNPRERRIFLKEYYRKYGTGAPLSESGLPDWTDGMDLQEFIEEMEYDYDGLILDEGGTGGYGDEVKSRGLSYVVFDPSQVKNVDNKTPTDDPDIRYSDREKSGSYSYESLVSKPDMPITTLSANVPSSRADVVYQAKQNARKFGTFNIKDGSVSVFVKDINTDVVLSTNGLKHSLDRRFDVNAPVTLMAGSILQNSIKLNEMTAQHSNAESSYILVGAAEDSKRQLYIIRSVVNRFSNEVTSMDVLYAFNAKTEPDLSIKKETGRETIPNGPQQKAATITGSTISIAKLLNYVNIYFPDILPESVLRHYGHDARPAGKLGESALYSDRYGTETAIERQNEKLKADVQKAGAVSSNTGAAANGDSFTARIRNEDENINEKFSMRDSVDSKSFDEDKYFARQMDKWDELDAKKVRVGTIMKGSALNRVGLPDSGLYFDVSKIKTEMEKHEDHLSKEILKGIPSMLDNPVVISEYKGPSGRIKNTVNVYGNLFYNNHPIVVGIVMRLDRSGQNVISNIRTIHARGNFFKHITDDSVLYLNEDKKMTRNWFQVCGNLSVPLEGTRFGLIRSITFDSGNVNDEPVKFSDRQTDVPEKQNEKLNDAMERLQEEHKAEVSDIRRQWDEEVEAIRASMKYDAEEELNKVIGTYKNQRKAAVENRNRTQYRQQIHKMAEKFHKMATAPAKADTAHAPIRLVNSIAKFCEIFAESEARAIEYASNTLDGRETNMRLMNDLRGQTRGRIREADVINRQRDRLLRKSQAISSMKEQYASIQKDSAFAMFYDEHVNQLLNDLDSQLSGTDIYEMDTNQLKQVYNTMQAMMYTITNANRVFSMEKDKTLLGVTRKLAKEIDGNKISHGALATNARRYGMWQMRPDTFFNFICGFSKGNEGKTIAKMFSDGTDRMLSVQRDFYQMFRHLTEAKDKKTAKHIQQMMQNPMKEMIDWGLKDAAGNPVKTTRDMMLQAYMLMNQKDSFDSLVYGGFKLPKAKMYYDGKVDNAYGDAEESALLSEAIGESYMDLVREMKDAMVPVHELESQKANLKKQLAEMKRQFKSDAERKANQSQINSLQYKIDNVDKQINDAMKPVNALKYRGIEMVEGAQARVITMRNAIEKQLTDVDMDAIETAKRWYKYTGQLMTDVYLQMYGYKPNLVDGYVPIHRDMTTVKTDIREGEESKAFNLENSGFTKDRVKSVAPILLTGFFQELGSQQQRISRYYGFAQVQKDFNRIWNLRMPGARTTINTKVAAKYGTGKTWLGVSGEQYVLNFIQSVAGVRAHDDIMSKFYGNAASATLSANPRVAVSQLASIPTAAAVVGWKSMAVGFTKGIGTSLSTQKKNLLANDSVWFFQRYRGAGGITELSDLKSKGGIWSKIANSAVGKHLFNWCQSMDVFATASMWAMAEDYVQSNGMKQTDEGYKLAVEQCYADIIRQSQPNYTVTERSDMLRDKRGGMKLLTMYKTQSNQNLNILIDAIGEYRAAKMAVAANKNNTTVADLKHANKRLVNGITSVTIGGTLAFVLLRTLVNFALGWVDPYRDEETGELTMEAFGKAVIKEAISSTAGMFALGGQLYDAVNSVVSGDYYYGISDTAVSSLATSAENLVTLIQRLGDPDKDVEWKHIEKALSSTLATCGIPYKNGKRFVEGAQQWYRDLTGGTLGQYTMDASDKQYRARILRGWQNGDMEKVDDALALLAARSDKDTDEEVALDVAHGFANSYLKEKVKEGEELPDDAIKLLEYIGHDDPEGVTDKWIFQMEHPDSELSEAGIRAWNNNQDIPLDLFEAAYKYKGANNRKADVVAYIQGLSVSAEMKRQLWNALKGTWKDKDTPWE